MASANGLRKKWRESACLILLAGGLRYSRQLLPLSMAKRAGRAPLLCLEQEGRPEFLFVKRSSKSGFMAGNHVFPGGVLDKADSCESWLELFKHCARGAMTHPFSSLLELTRRPTQPRLPSYETIPPDAPVPGEVAFRICAVREIFEEAGVLLVRDFSQVSGCLELLPGSFKPSVKQLPGEVLKDWMERVHNDAGEFVRMCRELHCVPDIWSLVEWSSWLTPPNLKRRYDTVFYFCCLESRPLLTHDPSEVSQADWMCASDALERSGSGEVKLAPPQLVEILTFSALDTGPSIHSYALHEALNSPCFRKRTVRIRTKDGSVMAVQQGDDIFPLEPEAAQEGTSSSPQDGVHQCSSPALRGLVKLVPHDGILWEYECPAHTAEELNAVSVQRHRLVVAVGDYKYLSMKVLDNVVSKKIEDHHKRYQECLAAEARSKL